LYIRFKIPFLKFKLIECVFDWDLLCIILGYTSVAAIAAFNAVTRIDDFVIIVQQNIGRGITGFMAQNKGKGNFISIRKVFLVGVKLEVIYSLVLMGLIFVFAEELMILFMGRGELQVVEAGVQYLILMAFLYYFPD